MDLLDKMATYVRVIEAGSFSAAAKQLRISPAAVSRQIATLEAEVRATLVFRSTRRMTVTPAGQRYYGSCLRILREVDDAQTTARGTAVAGALVITTPVTFGLASVMPMLHTLLAAHPAIRLDVRFEDRIVDLAFEGIDVAIRVGALPPISTELIAHPLATFRRVIVASPAYLKRHGEPKTPPALARHDALSHAVDGGGEAWTLVRRDELVRVHLRITCASNSGYLLRERAIAGAGIAMLPAWFVRHEIAARRLRIVLDGWQSEPIAVHAIHRTTLRGEARVRALVAHLKAAFAALPGYEHTSPADAAAPQAMRR